MLYYQAYERGTETLCLVTSTLGSARLSNLTVFTNPGSGNQSQWILCLTTPGHRNKYILDVFQTQLNVLAVFDPGRERVSQL